ncbi:hypothetical protein E2C01_001078 [Portunus trituberculatus]|uniref:Uncharacterized protein n=1 Tax=Portunus trituberculatus TaxID=210409 RepID=A0A5B7CFT3_PORTR|nr:hypothetical protein [Portunus trituberculatus]
MAYYTTPHQTTTLVPFPPRSGIRAHTCYRTRARSRSRLDSAPSTALPITAPLQLLPSPSPPITALLQTRSCPLLLSPAPAQLRPAWPHYLPLLRKRFLNVGSRLLHVFLDCPAPTMNQTQAPPQQPPSLPRVNSTFSSILNVFRDFLLLPT